MDGASRAESGLCLDCMAEVYGEPLQDLRQQMGGRRATDNVDGCMSLALGICKVDEHTFKPYAIAEWQDETAWSSLRWTVVTSLATVASTP